MQQQVNSYTFQLNENLQKSVLECHLSESIFYMTARQRSNLTKDPLSFLYKLHFQQQNPRKSQIKRQTIDGNIQEILSYSKDNEDLLVIISDKDQNYHLKKTSFPLLQNQSIKFQTIYTSESQRISLLHHKQSKRFFLTKKNQIDVLNEDSLDRRENVVKIGEDRTITSCTIDPIHQLLTYVINERQIIITDKNIKNDKFNLKIGEKDLSTINSIDYNPNKQYYLMSCHNQCLKFWDVRKPNLPIKVHADHHSIVLNAKYNLSHDQLISCSYDDGTVGLLRMNSVSSVPGENQDTLIKLYDQHEDSVYNIKWANFSPWIFASLSYSAANIVVNFVPSVQKYRILL